MDPDTVPEASQAEDMQTEAIARVVDPVPEYAGIFCPKHHDPEMVKAAELIKKYYHKIHPYMTVAPDGSFLLARKYPVSQLGDAYLFNNKECNLTEPNVEQYDPAKFYVSAWHRHGGFGGFFKPDLIEVGWLLRDLATVEMWEKATHVFITTKCDPNKRHSSGEYNYGTTTANFYTGRPIIIYPTEEFTKPVSDSGRMGLFVSRCKDLYVQTDFLRYVAANVTPPEFVISELLLEHAVEFNFEFHRMKESSDFVMNKLAHCILSLGLRHCLMFLLMEFKKTPALARPELIQEVMDKIQQTYKKDPKEYLEVTNHTQMILL